jgi:NADPH:quinone reductase-like Zn-dependent oxidoreductase
VFAVYAEAPNPAEPLAALVLGERPEPEQPPGWVLVRVRAASLNMHDVNTLRGVRTESYPMILGCDASGVLDDGTEVVVHSCVSDPSWAGAEALDPERSVLSERFQGSFAQTVAVPARNAVPKPPSLTHAEAACLPTAWLTAYRMVFVNAAVRPGQTVLVDGRDRLGSISAAAIALARAAGLRVWATARNDRDRALAAEQGAHRVFAVGEPLPQPADAVLDAGVDDAGWSHLTGLVRPGGAIVCAGWRRGVSAVGYCAALDELIFREIRLVGSTMGEAEDLAALVAFLDLTGLRPKIAEQLPLGRASEGFRAMLGGGVPGKIVFTVDA